MKTTTKENKSKTLSIVLNDELIRRIDLVQEKYAETWGHVGRSGIFRMLVLKGLTELERTRTVDTEI